MLGPLGVEAVGDATASCRESPPLRSRERPKFLFMALYLGLAFRYNLTTNLRGMNFLVFPYYAVLNVRVLDDAVVADGHVWADGAVFDDYVLADVARVNQLDVVHRLVLANDVANVVEHGPVLQ